MVVVLKASNNVIGSAGYYVIEDNNYSIDYDFNPHHWYRGL
jgi:hypothetical protein